MFFHRTEMNFTPNNIQMKPDANCPLSERTRKHFDSSLFIQKDDISAIIKEGTDQFKKNEKNYMLQNQSCEIPTDIHCQKVSFQQTFGQFCPLSLNQQVLQIEDISIYNDKCDQRNQDIIIQQRQDQISQNSSDSKVNEWNCSQGDQQIKKLKRTDQYLFKRRHTILKKCLISISLRHYVKAYKSHRKDYFVLILNLIQRQGLLHQLKQSYLSRAAESIQQISAQLQSSLQKYHLQEAIKLIQNSIKVVQLFCEGNISQAFNLIYGLNKLTRMGDFKLAKQIFNKERRKLGLQKSI